jgi:hypothetical protein
MYFQQVPLLCACGGPRGTSQCVSGLTEARLIEKWLRQRGVQHVYRDDFSTETIGNLVFAYIGFLLPLGARRVFFVTDSIHAPRLARLADHILRNLAEVIVTAVDPTLSIEETRYQEQLECAGSDFVDALLDEVPPGDPGRAFEWVSVRHQAKPYAGWKLSDVRTRLQQQVRANGAQANGGPQTASRII